MVFGCDHNEEWDALSDEDEDINHKKIEDSVYEVEEPHEDDESINNALVIYED